MAVTRRLQSWLDEKAQAQEPCANIPIFKFPHLMRDRVTASSKSESLQLCQGKGAALCPAARTSWVEVAQEEKEDGCLKMSTSTACWKQGHQHSQREHPSLVRGSPPYPSSAAPSPRCQENEGAKHNTDIGVLQKKGGESRGLAKMDKHVLLHLRLQNRWQIPLAWGTGLSILSCGSPLHYETGLE